MSTHQQPQDYAEDDVDFGSKFATYAKILSVPLQPGNDDFNAAIGSKKSPTRYNQLFAERLYQKDKLK